MTFPQSLVFGTLCLFCSVQMSGQTIFQSNFHDRTLRVDYFHTGTGSTETVSLDEMREEGSWAGSKRNLLDTLNLGEYAVRMFDLGSTSMIFSRGFSTIFHEWQSTDEALAGISRTFHESVRLPLPKRPAQIVLARRDKNMLFHEVFSFTVDPGAAGTIRKDGPAIDFPTSQIHKGGAPESSVDLVILADGYTADEMPKFRADARHFTDALFSTSPFKERSAAFNVWIIESPSDESGIDKPDKNVWRRNVLGSTYNTFGSARYILTTENKRLRDIASMVPYDYMNILVNDDRYGGGGIYNLYATCYTKTDHPDMKWQMDYVYVHEFGHSFAGLGDEYYGSQVSYNDLYRKGVEPWEPNIAASVDRSRLKWRSFVSEQTPLPTPWEKRSYDSLEIERGKLDRLASDYYKKREPIYRAERQILETTTYRNAVGAFEGAGYAFTGLYRPSSDCRMFSLSLVDFDPVCSASITRVIDFFAR